MRGIVMCLAFGFLFALPVRSQEADPAQPSVQLPPELDRVLRDYESRFRIGGDTLAALFAKEGFVLPTGRPPIRGRAEIARFYSRAGGALALRAIAYAAEGDVGFIIGGCAFGDGSADLGKFTLTLRKGTDGRWLIFSDMDNANRRPSPNSP